MRGCRTCFRDRSARVNERASALRSSRRDTSSLSSFKLQSKVRQEHKEPQGNFRNRCDLTVGRKRELLKATGSGPASGGESVARMLLQDASRRNRLRLRVCRSLQGRDGQGKAARESSIPGGLVVVWLRLMPWEKLPVRMLECAAAWALVGLDRLRMEIRGSSGLSGGAAFYVQDSLILELTSIWSSAHPW